MFKWVREWWWGLDDGEPNLVTEVALIEGEAMNVLKEAIDNINEHMPILRAAGRRVHLWVDRTQDPHRLQLCSWEDCVPVVIFGDD